MTDCDLTVIVTAHDETTVCGPTMVSADVAVERAREEGYGVQTVIALDAPTPQTAAYFGSGAFDHWEHMLFDERDLGRVRNEVVRRADGRYIAFLDADDLFSSNWLRRGVATLDAARERGEPVIVHPELNVLFDGANSILVNPASDSPLVSPYYLYVRNYYDSLCMSPREAHLDVPYVHRDIPNGLSYQDWQYTIETLQAGWKHEIVRDTIIFKRRRDSSLLSESGGRKSIVRVLPGMAIDRVRDLIPTSPTGVADLEEQR